MNDRLAAAALSRRLILKWLAAASASTWLGGCGSAAAPPLPAGGGDARRVLIIGAGMAGLAAANALNNAGVECLILEGRDRIGGRLWTRDLGGAPIDFGASWIHDPTGNPMTAFAQSAGVTQTPVDPTRDLLQFFLYQEESGAAPVTDVVEGFGHYSAFEQLAPQLLRQLGPQASLKDAILQYVSEVGPTLLPEQRRLVTHVIRYVEETFDSGAWETISLDQHVNSPIDNYGGSQFGDFPDGGYTRLVQAMAARSDIRLGHRVTRVVSTADGVSVYADAVQDGRSVPVVFSGSHALVTLPLGVLKAGTVTFEPPLSDAKRSAIERVGFGHFEKIALRFEEPFWERGLPKHSYFYFRSGSATQPTEFPFFLDLQKTLNIPVLVGLTSADFAQAFAAMPAADALARVQAILREAYGDGIPQPTAVLTSSWSLDEFTRGAYSYLPLGATAADMDTLAEPHGARVLFAGEASYKQRYGYADGALSSGLREVNRLLGITNAFVRP